MNKKVSGVTRRPRGDITRFNMGEAKPGATQSRAFIQGINLYHLAKSNKKRAMMVAETEDDVVVMIQHGVAAADIVTKKQMKQITSVIANIKKV